MKSYELLDVLGDVNEDYVRAADANVVRPRSRWKALVACAACAVLVLAAYPVYRAGQPKLHDYTVMEGGVGEALETDLDEMVKAPAGGPAADTDSAPEATMINGADKGGASMYKEQGGEIDGSVYSAPAEDAPADEDAAAQYSKLLQGMGGVDGLEPAVYPDWFAGAWLEQDALAVAVVDGFRTPELEAEVAGWCGGEVVFRDAKYSYPHLNSLMEQTVALLDGTGLSCGIGVYVMDNCVGVDLYGDGAAVPDDILEKLARLDPDGDAIRVRLFTERLSTYDHDETGMKDPVADSRAIATPSAGSAQPAAKPSAAPGGVTQPSVNESPTRTENGQPAHYDLLDGADK